MGGNAVINGRSADRINVKKEGAGMVQAIVKRCVRSVFDCAYSPSDDWDGFYYWSGSTAHLFGDYSDPGTRHLVDRIGSIGDIDIMVDRSKITPEMFDEYWTHMDGFIGYKVSGEQIITLWQTDIGCIQIDFELVEFIENKRRKKPKYAPSEWDKYIHASPWDDYIKGIKGVAHKYLWRALTSLHVKMGSNKWAFSLNGLRRKTIFWDDEGMSQDTTSIDDESPYITDPGAIYDILIPGNKLTGDPWYELASFNGLAHHVYYELSPEQLQHVYTQFEKIARKQVLYRDDLDRHYREISIMLKALREFWFLPDDASVIRAN